MHAISTLLGRCLLSLVFLLSAFSKLGAQDSTIQFMSSHGIPFSGLLIYATIFLELAAALCLIIGYKARFSALVLFLFLIPVTYVFHFKLAMSPETSEIDKKLHMIHTLKNLAIQGGLLLVFCNGSGALSLSRDQKA